MKKIRRGGNFFLTLLINIVLNIELAIPGVILIVLHFIFDISIWWGIGALVLWVLYLVVSLLILGFVVQSSNTPEKPKINKNPYSNRIYKSEKIKDDNLDV